ncbi:MAG: glycoside hydrolase family 5 protein [Bacteroides sp.]|nr:glycoside hydrolase family 5 protein [Bacteroides sp.]MCM1391080.1 glycoside hydrolase family 5 protein [Bacteroides sp.]
MEKNISRLALAAIIAAGSVACSNNSTESSLPEEAFVRVQGQDLIRPDGTKLYIVGTNLGNWLNPEGYMFGFSNTNSPRFINEMFCEMVGEEFTADFWKQFKDNYITRKDVEFIASTGANTIRLPFHYKLFTDEDYMGLASSQDGFARVDSVVKWCRDNELYLILDMHDAPGGQTGDNIDDSYGYPWLFDDESAQQKFCDIWRDIAEYYKNEPVILGYELINEPIAPYFENVDELNSKLEPLHKRAVAAIREVDKNHIILLGGSQWNGNFKPFADWKYDDKLMYTCHRYGSEPTADAIRSIIEFRDSVNLPMYMGEIGHNTYEWQRAFCDVMEENNIGYTFWPYKKIDGSCMMGVKAPENWDSIVGFAEAPRDNYASIRKSRPEKGLAQKAMLDFIENSKAENCVPQKDYIRSIKLNVN